MAGVSGAIGVAATRSAVASMLAAIRPPHRSNRCLMFRRNLRRSVFRVNADSLVFLSGVTLVAWKSKEVLGWQLYDANARPQGNPGCATNPGSGAAVVVLSNGSFVLFP